MSTDKQSFVDTNQTNYISPIIAWEAKGNQVDRWLTSSDDMAQHNQKTFTFLKHITGQLHRHGIPLLVGSDAGVLLSPHGLATHNEMAQLQAAGLTPIDVLQAATLMPARALGKSEEIGAIKEGLKADFILTLKDPSVRLEQLTFPDAVIKDGIWLSKNELSTLREQAVSSRSWWSEFWVLLTNY